MGRKSRLRRLQQLQAEQIRDDAKALGIPLIIQPDMRLVLDHRKRILIKKGIILVPEKKTQESSSQPCMLPSVWNKE